MTPEAIVLTLCILLLLVVFIYWLTRRSRWQEPKSDPLFTPSREDVDVMVYNHLSYLDWVDATPSERAAARDAYYSAKGL